MNLLQTITQSEAKELIYASSHTLHISRHRAWTISRRVKLVSAIFAVLTPLWIIVDALVFPWPIWGAFALMRLLSAAAFAALAFIPHDQRSPQTAFLMLGVLLAIPPIFYLLSQPFLEQALAQVDSGTLTHVVISSYSLLPLIVVAGLSVFPLTLLEVLIAAAGILGIIAIGVIPHKTMNPEDLIIGGWMLMLMLGVSAMSGMLQLRYMITLVNQASLDVLTQVFSRRSGEETLDLQFRIASRTQSPLTILFIDVDNFKSINDKFGHEAGDHALQQLAETLLASLRKSDILARWGGEEFVAILPSTDANGTIHILKRLSKNGLGLRPDHSKLTVSMGVAERIADGIEDWEQLVTLADKRMYQSKMGGKNRCTGYDALTALEPLIPPA